MRAAASAPRIDICSRPLRVDEPTSLRSPADDALTNLRRASRTTGGRQ